MSKVIAEQSPYIKDGSFRMKCPFCDHVSWEISLHGETIHQCHACHQYYEVEIPWLEPPKPRKPRLGRLIGGVPIQ